MKRAVIIIGNGFEDSECLYPFYRLQEAVFSVDVATKGQAPVAGKHGIPMTPTVDAEAIRAEDYDMAVIPGGHESPDLVRSIDNVKQFLQALNQQGKIVTTICHGGWVLASAGIVNGRQLTCHPNCKDDLVNAGAHYEETAVRVDRNIISSPHYRHNAEWMRKTIKQYEKLNQPATAAAGAST